MRKRDALRLKSGDVILCADDQYTAKASQWWRGQVLCVEPTGRIKVRIIEAKSPRSSWQGPGTGPGVESEQWIHYTHVVAKDTP
jgi:hypothetical protein